MRDFDSQHLDTHPERQPLSERLFVAVQHALPQHALSGLMFRLTRMRWGPAKNLLIRRFAAAYGVDLDEAAASDPADYEHFNAFFTRALRPDARPLEGPDDQLVSPVDGAVSQLGAIAGDGRMVQAKGRWFTLTDLLGGREDWASRFDGGQFATIYLSPKDYHRIHMPIAGRLTGALHVPGRLFSVNPATARGVPGLFARNERLICLFDTALGPMAMVLVGAIFVGSMETLWHGMVTPPGAKRIHEPPIRHGDQPLALARGDEMGRFNMGSTVILLLPRDALEWELDLAPGTSLRQGRAMARA